MSDVKPRNKYSPRVRVRTNVSGESRTHQSFKEQCDVNRILSKFSKTGVVEHMSSVKPFYGDCTLADSYHESLIQVIDAESGFLKLPSMIRKRFENDPYEFLKFIGDENNREEAIRMGLIERKIDSGTEKSVVDKEAVKAESVAKASTEAKMDV